MSNGVIRSNYSLCLVAYALALGGSPKAAIALTELSKRDDYTGDFDQLWRKFFRNKDQWLIYEAKMVLAHNDNSLIFIHYIESDADELVS